MKRYRTVKLDTESTEIVVDEEDDVVEVAEDMLDEAVDGAAENVTEDVTEDVAVAEESEEEITVSEE